MYVCVIWFPVSCKMTSYNHSSVTLWTLLFHLCLTYMTSYVNFTLRNRVRTSTNRVLLNFFFFPLLYFFLSFYFLCVEEFFFTRPLKWLSFKLGYVLKCYTWLCFIQEVGIHLTVKTKDLLNIFFVFYRAGMQIFTSFIHNRFFDIT